MEQVAPLLTSREVNLRRRQFITLAGSAAATWPLAAGAHQGERLRRIGWLDPAPETDPSVQVRKTVVQQSFERMGWSVGRNLAIDDRWGIFDLERARRAGAEIVSLSPDVILCAASPHISQVWSCTGFAESRRLVCRMAGTGTRSPWAAGPARR